MLTPGKVWETRGTERYWCSHEWDITVRVEEIRRLHEKALSKRLDIFLCEEMNMMGMREFGRVL